MQTTTRSRLARAALIASASFLALAFAAAPATATATTSTGSSGSGLVRPPQAYYLSLGDSLAFGFQDARFGEMMDAGAYDPEAFDTGFTDVLAARLRKLRHGQRTVNLACPGETLRTMIVGGCEWTLPEPDGPGLPIHTRYRGSQLDAAVRFLRARPRKVAPVTVAIGANDVAEVVAGQCEGDAACVEQSGLRQRLRRRLGFILSSLRDAAPQANIVLVVTYNPFVTIDPGTDAIWERNYVSVASKVARRNGVRVANLTKVVHGDGVCRLTYFCESGDVHPTDAGYRRIGNYVFRVAGYDDDHCSRGRRVSSSGAGRRS